MVGTRPWRRCAELFEPHVDEFLGPVDVACGSLQVDVVPFPALAFDVIFNLPQQHSKQKVRCVSYGVEPLLIESFACAHKLQPTIKRFTPT